MCVEYFFPSLIKDDDDYLKLVFLYGDTVSQSAHKKALDSLGVKINSVQPVQKVS